MKRIKNKLLFIVMFLINITILILHFLNSYLENYKHNLYFDLEPKGYREMSGLFISFLTIIGAIVLFIFFIRLIIFLINEKEADNSFKTSYIIFGFLPSIIWILILLKLNIVLSIDIYKVSNLKQYEKCSLCQNEFSGNGIDRPFDNFDTTETFPFQDKQKKVFIRQMKKDGRMKCYYSNFEGLNIFDFYFDAVYEFENGYAIVNYEGKFGVLDSIGQFSIEPNIECILEKRNNFIICYYGKVGSESGPYCFESGEQSLKTLNGQTLILTEKQSINFENDSVVLVSDNKKQSHYNVNQKKYIIPSR